MTDALDLAEPRPPRWAGVVVPLSAGATLFAGMVLGGFPRLTDAWEVWYFRGSAAAGAIAGCAIVRRRFGLAGWAGLARAVLAFAIALFAGGMIGGMLFYGVAGALAGPGILIGVIVGRDAWGIAAFILGPFAALRVTARWRARRFALDDAPFPPARPLLWWNLAMLAYAVLMISAQL